MESILIATIIIVSIIMLFAGWSYAWINRKHINFNKANIERESKKAALASLILLGFCSCLIFASIFDLGNINLNTGAGSGSMVGILFSIPAGFACLAFAVSRVFTVQYIKKHNYIKSTTKTNLFLVFSVIVPILVELIIFTTASIITSK